MDNEIEALAIQCLELEQQLKHLKQQIADKMDWLALSFYFYNEHYVIYKSLVDGNVEIWETPSPIPSNELFMIGFDQ